MADWTELTLSLFSTHARASLQSARGAFDLPSILVGVVVVGILTAGVLASVFGVIPFAQDNGARQDLSAHRTAEGVAMTKDGRYLDSAGLTLSGYAQKTANTAVGTDAQGSCYVGVAVSPAGKIFYSTNKTADPQVMTGFTDTGCLTRSALESLVASAGATMPAISGTSLMAWGSNYNGRLATSNTAYNPHITTPTDVPAMAGKTITAITADGTHTCAFADHDTYCWGQGYDGNLGNGSYAQNNIPTKVTALAGKTVTDIAANGHTCAVADGEVYCWGQGGWGELGNGVKASSNVPVKVIGLESKTVTAVKVSWNHTCAIADGEVYCWGWGQRGQLGNGSINTSAVPVKALGLAGMKVTALSAGTVHTCAVAAGSTYCWGENLEGQLGTGNLDMQRTPAVVTALSGKDVSALTTGSDSNCAVGDGGVYCWGNNDDGQLGVGDTVDRSTPTLVNGLAGKTVISIDHAGSAACAATPTDTYCWGYRDGVPTGEFLNHITPTVIPALSGKTVVKLAGGFALIR